MNREKVLHLCISNALSLEALLNIMLAVHDYSTRDLVRMMPFHVTSRIPRSRIRLVVI